MQKENLSTVDHPAADLAYPGEEKPLLSSSSGSTNKKNDNNIGGSYSDQHSRWFSTINMSTITDPEKGWLRFWNPALTFRQLTVRDRESSFYAFDAFRALAYLWVSNDHVQEGLMALYSNFHSWSEQNMSRSYVSSSAEGVTVFFVISGFLNLYVALRISARFKEKHVSWKTIRNFLFRRYMHLAPNLYIAVCIALALGCLTGSSLLYNNLCTPCENKWWTDFVFIQNLPYQFVKGSNCFNSTWTIGAEMQFYFMSVPIIFLYSYHRPLAFALILALIGLTVWMRTVITIGYATSYSLFGKYVYQPSYTRADAYFFGMGLYMM